MHKSRYYPFERNRYFYGKLLTVRDFEAEQTYFNDKRRLLNRLLHGTGVIAGLQVIKVDDKSISVQAGVALDHLGREIVLPDPMTWKLSMMEGFENNGDYAKNVYLCIAYDEKGKEPVHSVAGSTGRKEEISEYNRLFESSRVFIKEEAPDRTAFEDVNLAFTTSVLYQDAGLRIVHQVPRYVRAGESFEAKVLVEKTVQTKRIAFEFDLESESCKPMQSSKVTFVEPVGSEQIDYEITYPMQAVATAGIRGHIAFRGKKGQLQIGDRQIIVELPGAHRIDLIQESVQDRILQEYFSRSLDRSLKATPDASICLARISLMQVGPNYMIERVEQMPFGEVIYNPTLLMKLGLSPTSSAAPETKVNASAERSVEKQEPPQSQPEPSLPVQPSVTVDQVKQEEPPAPVRLPQEQPRQEVQHTATGYTDVFLMSSNRLGINPFGKGDRHFYSDEIAHGLGAGDVLVTVGMEGNDGLLSQGETVFYGDQDVFRQSEFASDLPKVSIGTIVYPKKGTFRIGLRVHGPTELGKIRVRWWAMKNMSDHGMGHFQWEAAAMNSEEDDDQLK